MIKGLEALKDFREHYFFELDEEENLNAIEKELKALEIIKKKKVNVKWLLNSNSCEEYNKWYDMPLTQEEFKLLEEVLL